jgi:hypothetical protein
VDLDERARSLALYLPLRRGQGARPAGKVAVLLYGVLRTFEVTAPSLLRHVVEPNDADIFYFGPQGSDNPTAAHEGTKDLFGSFTFNPKGGLDTLAPVDAAALQQAYGGRLRLARFHDVGTDRFEDECALKDPAEWVYGLNPVRLFSMFYNLAGAAELLVQYEQQHGSSYDCVVITRPDLAFFSPVCAEAQGGELHIPAGQGIDGWGVKHRGNARVLYYKNVETGEFLEGNDRLLFNDQLYVLARRDLDLFRAVYEALPGYLARRVPASPETILFLHLVARGGLRPIEHDEWCYEIYRAGMPLQENVLDTPHVALIDRHHPRAQALRRRHPVVALLRDAKLLLRKALNRLLR